MPEEALLRERLRLLARRHPRYGYRRIHAILRREGWLCNRKRVQRLWRDEGLRLPARPRRRRRGPRMPGHLVAAEPDQVWAIDFISDRTADGRPLKILTVTDEHTREALATPAARRMGAEDTVNTLEQIVRKLREADRLRAEGADIDAVCRQLEVSVQTYQRWRSQFKAMRPEDVVRLKQLEKENARLKRLLAEKELDNDMLREVARGNW